VPVPRKTNMLLLDELYPGRETKVNIICTYMYTAGPDLPIGIVGHWPRAYGYLGAH